MEAYNSFLSEIGYLVPEGEEFAISTENVDLVISTIAGPQFVVPLTNARYDLNAVNVRWGSLYDALCGTDATPETGGAERNGAFNPVRDKRVIDYGRSFLDLAAPLADVSHRDATGYAVKDATLVVTMGGGKQVGLANPSQFEGYNGEATAPSAVLLGNHRLHLEIVIDRTGLIGKDDAAGVDDVLLESAVTTIMDCKDSVAAVDGEDKVLLYRN